MPNFLVRDSTLDLKPNTGQWLLAPSLRVWCYADRMPTDIHHSLPFAVCDITNSRPA